MSYVQENLLNDETILYQAKIHWVVYLPAAITFLLALAFMSVPIFSAGLIFLSVCIAVRAIIYTHTTEFAVTNLRIIAKTGWVSRTAVELRHDKVEGVLMNQSIMGRILNYGTILLHGTGSGITPVANIDNPLEFRKAALGATEQYQHAR